MSVKVIFILYYSVIALYIGMVICECRHIGNNLFTGNHGDVSFFWFGSMVTRKSREKYLTTGWKLWTYSTKLHVTSSDGCVAEYRMSWLRIPRQLTPFVPFVTLLIFALYFWSIAKKIEIPRKREQNFLSKTKLRRTVRENSLYLYVAWFSNNNRIDIRASRRNRYEFAV